MKEKSTKYSILETAFANVQVACHPVRYPLPADMQRNIECYWQKEKHKKHLFNGSLLRLDSWLLRENVLQINASITDYQTLLYTNKYTRLVAEKWGKQFHSRALGISSLVISRDQFLVFMRRSNNVGEYRNCIDVFGGHIGIDETSVTMDIRQAMLKEIKEELGLPPADVNLEYLAFIQCNAHAKPELLFLATTALSVRDIIYKSVHARDKFEYTNIILVPSHRQTLAGFLKTNARLMSPSAYGCLELYIKKYIS